jgi:hypothetical protein
LSVCAVLSGLSLAAIGAFLLGGPLLAAAAVTAVASVGIGFFVATKLSLSIHHCLFSSSQNSIVPEIPSLNCVPVM